MLHNKDFSMFDLSILLGDLIDRQNIQDTIARSSLAQRPHHGKDSEIFQQWDETFSKEGQVDYSVVGGPVGSYRYLAKWLRGNGDTPSSMSAFSNWQHMLSLPIVTLAGDKATARTDFFASHRGRPDRGFNVHYNVSGAFHDEMVRTLKGWRIRFRRLEVYFGDALQIGSSS
jgi:SnoaL-like domain